MIFFFSNSVRLYSQSFLSSTIISFLMFKFHHQDEKLYTIIKGVVCKQERESFSRLFCIASTLNLRLELTRTFHETRGRSARQPWDSRLQDPTYLIFRKINKCYVDPTEIDLVGSRHTILSYPFLPLPRLQTRKTIHNTSLKSYKNSTEKALSLSQSHRTPTVTLCYCQPRPLLQRSQDMAFHFSGVIPGVVESPARSKRSLLAVKPVKSLTRDL